jgi:hypothetical protein
MEQPRHCPSLVHPGDLAPGQDALIVADRAEPDQKRPSPFAAATWRLVPEAALPAAPPRRPHGVA